MVALMSLVVERASRVQAAVDRKEFDQPGRKEEAENGEQCRYAEHSEDHEFRFALEVPCLNRLAISFHRAPDATTLSLNQAAPPSGIGSNELSCAQFTGYMFD